MTTRRYENDSSRQHLNDLSFFISICIGIKSCFSNVFVQSLSRLQLILKRRELFEINLALIKFKKKVVLTFPNETFIDNINQS